MSDESPPPTEPDRLEDQRGKPGNSRSILRSGEVWLGFGGAIVGNVVLAVIVVTSASQVYGVRGSLIAGAPWLLNFGAVILFAIVRPRIAIGMLLAYGVAFALVLLGGIFLAIICFSGGGGIP